MVFILLAGLLAGIFLTTLASVRAAPQLQTMPGGVVISEFRFHGSAGASDEFVELFNKSGGTINLNGWKVKGSNNSGSTSTRYTFSSNILLAAGQHYLLANAGYNDAISPDATYSTGITDDGGVAVTLPDDTIIDQVGLSSGSAYKEGTPLAPLTTNVDRGYQRNNGGCTDTDNNFTDFGLVNPSTPLNYASSITYCTGVSTFTPTATSTFTPTTTNTSTDTPTNTSTATSTSTPTATNTSTSTPSSTPTQSPTYTSTTTPTATSTGTPTAVPTACLGSTISQWKFDGSVTSLSMGSGMFSNGSGLTGPTFASGYTGSNGDQAVSFSGWTTSWNANDYVEFDVNTQGRNSITLSFEYRSTSTGPTKLDVYYAISGATFNLLSSSNALQNDSNWHSITFVLGSIPSLNDDPNAKFKLFAYSASGSSGTLRLDNVTFTGSCMNPANTPTSTSAPVYPPLSLVINEVGWAGTAASSNDEWVEFYNPGSSDINLSGWDLNGLNSYYTSGNFTVPLSGAILAGGYFVLAENSNVFQNVTISQTSSSLSLLNSYEALQLISPADTLVDTANYSGSEAWPAGSASPNYASMERYYPPGGTIPADGPSSWVTFAGSTAATPLDRNGNHVYGTPGGLNWASTVIITPSPLPTATHNPTPTFAPTPIPAVVLNEILPRPGSDWNGDGVVNNYDEFIEVENLGPGIVDLENWKLDVMPDSGSSPFVLPSRKLNPNERAVFFGSTTRLLLEDSGDTVRLIDSRGVVEDAFTYPAVLQPDDSWCRIRDGIGNWRDGCFPTPGIENALSGILPSPPPPQPGGEAACQLPDIAPSEFRLAECNGSGAGIWNQQYWNDLSGQNEYAVPDLNSKSETYIQ